MDPQYGTLIVSLFFSVSCFVMLIVGGLSVLAIMAMAGHFDVTEHKTLIIPSADVREILAEVEPYEETGWVVKTSFVSDAHGRALVVLMERKRRKIFK